MKFKCEIFNTSLYVETAELVRGTILFKDNLIAV